MIRQGTADIIRGVNMKKVGILAINDYNNYGNRLQNFALQEVLNSLNIDVETIVNNTNFDYLFVPNESKTDKIKRLIKLSPQKKLSQVHNRV